MDDVTVRIERQEPGSPRFTRSAGPERHACRARHRDGGGDTASATHGSAINDQPHRRPRVAPGAQRVPERRGATRRRGTGEKEEHAHECDTGAGRHVSVRRTPQHAAHARRGERNRGGGARIGGEQQRGARSGTFGSGGAYDSDDASPPPPPFDEPRQHWRRRRSPRPPQRPDRARGACDDERPRERHS